MAMLTYVPGGMGGTETYARRLSADLAGREDVDLVRVVARASAGRLSAGEASTGHEVVAATVPGGDGLLRRLGTSAAAAVPSRAVRRAMARADVVHFPFTVPVPVLRAGRPGVVTLHDVQHLDLPGNFSRAELAYRRMTYDVAARRADAVVTISQFTRERIVERLGVAPERVHVALLGVDAAAFAHAPAEREPFVLYPARSWPHKNHARLIEAMALVRRRFPDLRLVLTGEPDFPIPLPSWAEHRGQVAFEELCRLYARASCVAFPSLYEGFGLPPLEAMASGCPVAVSNAGSLPEICGDAAVFFDPHRVEAIATGIEQALGAGDRLVDRGYRRVAELTWRRCGDAHLEALRSVVG